MKRRGWMCGPLCLLTWGACTLMFLGERGPWLDDWTFNLRDPASGRVTKLTTLDLPRQFWRPGLQVVTPAMTTALWEWPWAPHLISAVLHGSVGAGLWLLIVRVGCPRRAAWGAALLFIVCPVYWDVALWPTTIVTSISVLLAMALCGLCVRVAERGASAPRLAGCAAVGFLIPCFNEQPAAVSVCLPLLGMAFVPAGLPRAFLAPRVLGPGLAAAGAALVYVLLHYLTAGAAVRGGPGTFLALSEIPAELVVTAREVTSVLAMRGFVGGALQEGWSVLPAGAGLLAVGVIWAVFSALWMLGWAGAEGRGAERGSRVLVAAFGVAAFAAMWLPVLVIRGQNVYSRLAYAPVMALAIAAAAGTDLIAARLGGVAQVRRTLLWAVACGITVLAGLATLSMMGVQAALAARTACDRREAAALRALVPDPPRSAVFVPLVYHRLAAQTGGAIFDTVFHAPLQTPWAAPNWVRWVYRRTDLWCGAERYWEPARVAGADDRGLWYRDPVPGLAFEGGLTVVPWGRVVPLTVDGSGRLEIVGAISVRGEDGVRREFAVPAAAGVAGAAVWELDPERKIMERPPP